MSITEPHDDRSRQSLTDRATIKVRLIENGILIGAGIDGYFTFAKWEGKGGAAEHIGMRLERLAQERQEIGGAREFPRT